MNYEALGSIIGGTILLSVAILKFLPRRVSNGETPLSKEIVDLARRQLDILQEMRGEHKVQQIMLETVGRDVEQIRRDVRGAE